MCVCLCVFLFIEHVKSIWALGIPHAEAEASRSQPKSRSLESLSGPGPSWLQPPSICRRFSCWAQSGHLDRWPDDSGHINPCRMIFWLKSLNKLTSLDLYGVTRIYQLSGFLHAIELTK